MDVARSSQSTIRFSTARCARAWDISLRASMSEAKLFRNDITKFFNYEPGPDYSAS